MSDGGGLRGICSCAGVDLDVVVDALFDCVASVCGSSSGSIRGTPGRPACLRRAVNHSLAV